jgi:hypothetical protein
MYTLLKPAAASRIQMKKRQTDLMAWARAVNAFQILKINLVSSHMSSSV